MYQDYYNMYNPYYRDYENNYRSSEPPQFNSGEIITLNQAISLIKQSVGDEKEDEKFYDILIEQAPTDKEAVAKYRKILGTMPSGNSYTLLMSIMTDELRHASKYNFLIQNAK